MDQVKDTLNLPWTTALHSSRTNEASPSNLNPLEQIAATRTGAPV